MGIYLGSLIGLLMIACAILFAGRVFANEQIRGPLLDALTGVAIAYAFIDVFPHLASMQSKLELDYVSGFFAYLAHHVYLMALLGFIVYLGVKNSLLEDEEAGRRGHSRHLVLVASFCIYAFLIGYMLSEQPTHRIEPAILFAIAMAAHLLGLNYENRRLNPAAFDRYFRFFAGHERHRRLAGRRVFRDVGCRVRPLVRLPGRGHCQRRCCDRTAARQDTRRVFSHSLQARRCFAR